MLALPALLVTLVAAPEAAAAQPASGAPELRPEVAVDQRVLNELAGGGSTTFWVHLAERPDLSAAAGIADWAEQGRFVHDALTATADVSQAGLVGMLDAAGVDYQSFWISNTIRVTGGEDLLRRVAARPEVDEVFADRTHAVPEPAPGSDEARVNAVEWNIDRVNAPQVWAEFGVAGEGIVVGSIDTGVQYDHPALVTQYRGNLGGGEFDHNYNWFDPSQICGDPSLVPCDNTHHGTHTMGTMVGDDGGENRIGVAPGARWMAAKGCESRNCSTTALLASFQFMLAPTDLQGENPDPAMRPHVVNNSWGTTNGADPTYRDAVQAWVAAGMFPSFSNGNSGPDCGTAGAPASYPESYGVGAFDINNNLYAASSKGASPIDGGRKPNIAAPGVNVRSSIVGNRYGNLTGTSMAAPHVSGTVALMWSAAPALLRDIDATRAMLDQTAIDTEDLSCGGFPENNNVWGQGRLDAFQAVAQVVLDSGVAGQVTNADGEPVAGGRVAAVEAAASTRTDQDGRYDLRLKPGSYTLEFSAFGYEDVIVSGVEVFEHQSSTIDVTLVRLPTGTIAGTVTLALSGRGVPGVTMELPGVPVAAVTTGADGGYLFTDVPVGSYTVAAQPATFPQPAVDRVTVTPVGPTVADFSLECGEHCSPNVLWEARYNGPPGSRGDSARALAVSPDGTRVFVTGQSAGVGTGFSDYATAAYDTATGEELWAARYNGPGNGLDIAWAAGVSPDGSRVFVTGQSAGAGTSSDYATVAYDAATGEELWVARHNGPAGGGERAQALGVSADGSHLFVTGRSLGVGSLDYATVAYDAATGEELWAARHDGPANGGDFGQALDVSPDGSRVFVSGQDSGAGTGPDYATVAYDAATGEELWVARYNGPRNGSDSARALGVSPDSTRVVVTGNSQGQGSSFDYATVAYDAASGAELWVARHNGPANGSDQARALGVGPDGSRVFVTGESRRVGTSNGYATVAYDADSGEELWVARYDPGDGSHSARALGVTPDGTRVFVTGSSQGEDSGFDYATVAYGAASGEELWVARRNGPANGSDNAQALGVSPDGTRVFVTGENRGVDTNTDYATVAYDAKAGPEFAVFVPWDLRVQPRVAPGGAPVRVSVEVANVGAAPGEHTASLVVDGEIEDTTTLTLQPGETTQVDWTVARQEPSTYQIQVGHLAADLRVVACDQTVTGVWTGPLTVGDGVTCLAEGARLRGPVQVHDGAGLVSTGAMVSGRVTATGADVVQLDDNRITGGVAVTGTTGSLTLAGNQVSGPVRLHDNATGGTPIVVSGNTINGSLRCVGNEPPPVNDGEPNTAHGLASGQCADL